jgi:hypothetical protein
LGTTATYRGIVNFRNHVQPIPATDMCSHDSTRFERTLGDPELSYDHMLSSYLAAREDGVNDNVPISIPATATLLNLTRDLGVRCTNDLIESLALRYRQ